MNYWYINTEAKDFGGKSPHKKWFEHGCAFVSGKGYGRKLQRLQRDDICFMYANKKGVVAVGCVIEQCDGQEAQTPLIYCPPEKKGPEYQAKVKWFLWFPKNPIRPNKLRSITGSFARQAIQRIADPTAAASLLSHARQQAGVE